MKVFGVAAPAVGLAGTGVCRALVCGALVAVLASPAGASTSVAIVGEGISSDGRCLAVDGTSTAGRSRWLTGYWPQVTLPVPACSDTDPHFDPVITCVTVEATDPSAPDAAVVAYLSATGPERTNYALKIVDRVLGPDEFGLQALPRAPVEGAARCGAGDVATVEVVHGGFAISRVE